MVQYQRYVRVRVCVCTRVCNITFRVPLVYYIVVFLVSARTCRDYGRVRYTLLAPTRGNCLFNYAISSIIITGNLFDVYYVCSKVVCVRACASLLLCISQFFPHMHRPHCFVLCLYEIYSYSPWSLHVVISALS